MDCFSYVKKGNGSSLVPFEMILEAIQSEIFTGFKNLENPGFQPKIYEKGFRNVLVAKPPWLYSNTLNDIEFSCAFLSYS